MPLDEEDADKPRGGRTLTGFETDIEMIVVHTLLILVLVVGGLDYTARIAMDAESLRLPGAWIASWTPFIGGGVYLLILLFARKARKPLIRIAVALAAFAAGSGPLFYPTWLITRCSQRLEIDEFLPQAVAEEFQQRFETRIVQCGDSYGTYLLVPRDRFKTSMVSFLQTPREERAENQATAGDDPEEDPPYVVPDSSVLVPREPFLEPSLIRNKARKFSRTI